MADTPEVKAGKVVPFTQEEYDAFYKEEARVALEFAMAFRKAGRTFPLNCGDPPLLNPNGSLMLDENGNEMYAKGQSGPPEEPDE